MPPLLLAVWQSVLSVAIFRASFGPRLTAPLGFRIGLCRLMAVGVNYGTGPGTLASAEVNNVKIQRHSRRVCPWYSLLLAKLVALDLATTSTGKHFVQSARTAWQEPGDRVWRK